MPDIQRIGEQADFLGESPVWCDREQALYWVDVRTKLIRRYAHATGKIDTWPMPEMVGSIALREKGGLVVALATAICFFDPKTGSLERIAAPEAHIPNRRFNDGKCDRQGRFWVGTMHDITRETEGTMYRFDHDRSCVPIFGGVRCPNGLCFSPDGRTMYYADTPTRRLEAFDYDPATGNATNRREMARLPDTMGPDGSTVDAEGFVWNAQYDGWRLARYAPDGRLDRYVELPLQRPTSCAFGGPNRDILYVTTATQWLKSEELTAQPLAGALLALDVGVSGVPEARYPG